MPLHLEPVDAAGKGNLPVGTAGFSLELDFRSLRPLHRVIVRPVVQKFQQRQQILRLMYFQLLGAVHGVGRRIGNEVRQVIQVILLLLEIPVNLVGTSYRIPFDVFGRAIGWVKSCAAIIRNSLPFYHIRALVRLNLDDDFSGPGNHNSFRQAAKGRYVDVDELL